MRRTHSSASSSKTRPSRQSTAASRPRARCRCPGMTGSGQLGDCAAVPMENGDFCPSTAQFAMRQGALLGKISMGSSEPRSKALYFHWPRGARSDRTPHCRRRSHGTQVLWLYCLVDVANDLSEQASWARSQAPCHDRLDPRPVLPARH